MAEENIPGTRVPDTPIHRASLWLEDVKFGDRRADPDLGPEQMGETFQDFIDRAGANFTVEQMQEAASFYGENMLAMMTGGRLDFFIPSPTGDGFIDGRGLFASLWLDAFMHGFAAGRGKIGKSNEEMRHG